MYGQIEYNEIGMPKCELCGAYFHRVLSHVRQAHSMNEKDYKKAFGFDTTKGICSEKSAEKTRKTTLKSYDICIGKNLIANGKKTRFIKGCEGRTKDKVSAQTYARLSQQFKNVNHEKKNGSDAKT